MTTMDVIPFGHRQFVIQLFGVTNIPPHVEFGSYREAVCEIGLPDEPTLLERCLIYRPGDRRNVIGERTTDWLVVFLTTDLSITQLSSARICITQFDEKISEKQAILDYRFRS